MGIPYEVTRLLARFVKKTGVGGAVLTYGVQGIQGNYAQNVRWLEKERFAYRPQEPAQIVMDDKTEYGLSIHQDVLFRMLGFERIDSLDFYPDEQPTHLVDLNQPLPEGFHHQYDLVLDGGTMEHCLNVKEVLCNTARLVKEGGHVVHLNPMSGLVNHGFYQFSPTLYFDFYSENGFEDMEMKFVLEGRYVDYLPHYTFSDFLGESAFLLFTARKARTVSPAKIPIQAVYQQKFGTPGQTDSAADGGFTLSSLRDKIPSRRLVNLLLFIRKWLQIQRHAHRL